PPCPRPGAPARPAARSRAPRGRRLGRREVLPPVRRREVAHLGDDVWVVAFPRGRQMTLVSGTVSQVGTGSDTDATEGPVRLVDTSVSYGASGAGVFDAETGELIGVVEGYRTA